MSEHNGDHHNKRFESDLASASLARRPPFKGYHHKRHIGVKEISIAGQEALIEIKTFLSFDEIKCLQGFRSENPINKINYKRIIGDYWFENRIECCFQKPNGNLCKTKHNFGFVAELQDSTVTVVGNCCAKDKFGADAKIKADRSRYLNEKVRLERLQAVRKLLEEKNARLDTINNAKKNLTKIVNELNRFKNKLGPVINRKLVDMSKTGNNAVSLQIINLKEYIDDDGEQQVEKRITPTVIGHIKGVSIFNQSTFDSVYSAMDVVENVYAQIENIKNDLSTTELGFLTSRLEQFSTVQTRSEKLIKATAEFFDSDFFLLCFLSNDKSERYRAARIAMEQANINGGKERAKMWLAEKEQALKKALNADRLETSG